MTEKSGIRKMNEKRLMWKQFKTCQIKLKNSQNDVSYISQNKEEINGEEQEVLTESNSLI